MSPSELRALLVTYVFPPVGGAGVQRTAKLAKYLPEHGVLPEVLTAENPSVPLKDPSLLRDLPPGLRVLGAKTLEPSYAVKQQAWKAESDEKRATQRPPSGEAVRAPLAVRARATLARAAKAMLVPDAQLLWQPHAHWVLGRELLRDPPDVVLVSAPPFSQFLLAPLVRLRPGTAVILDYRDEWTMYQQVYEMISPATKVIGEQLERTLVHLAHAITTATPAFRDNLLRRFPTLDPERVVPIPNGYDSDDLPPALPELEAEHFWITYAGSILRMNSPRGFLAAVRLLHEREPALAARLRVRFLGRIVDTELDAFDGLHELGVERHGYVPHDRVVELLSESHMVLCTLADVPGARDMYPGKIFELMALGRPVLTCAPQGSLRALVAEHTLGPACDPDDAPAIARELELALRAFVEGRYEARSRATGVERFHRRAIAGEFAQVMRDAVRRAGGPRGGRRREALA
jgi:glycosyltransferase involved in cell wall biosynthesis